jgi:hypothetical protein
MRIGKRLLWISVLASALLALSATVVLAAGEGVPPAQEEVALDTLWTTLAPIVAIATFTERLLEMFWQRWEKGGAWPNKRGVPDSKAPAYISKKKASSHWLGTLIAVIIVGLTNVRFFRLLGVDVLFSETELFDLATVGGIFADFTAGTIVDWLMTAGIIGWGGTELTHSVIEGLVRGRNLWTEMREVEAGRRSILDAKFFNDYIAPELEKHGVSTASLRQTIETLNQMGVPVDELIGSMTSGQVDRLLGRLEAGAETAEAGRSVRNLLDGVPEEKQVEIPQILSLLTPGQRERFLGG